ncbi:MAG: sigma 54-interacting transcriptional regulator [Negativicutes bacterium]|nr:sigma 54-interacting transcriptional regulator [Negativicutes bacterium]
MAEIMVIAPQQEIADLVKELGWEGKIGIVHARLEQGVLAAREAVDAGAKVLVSRGLTYRMIADALPGIPSVEIKLSGYDVLRSFLEADAFKGRVAIVAQQEVLDGFLSIEEILGSSSKLLKIEIYDDRNYAAGVSEALQLGAACVIGNQAVVQEAVRCGLHGLPLNSGREAIKSALAAAQAVLDKLKMQEANARQIETIINSIDYGILAIDSQGETTALNAEARRLLYQDGEGQDREAAFVKTMLRRASENEKRTGLVERFGPRTEVVVNYLPITVNGAVTGMVATLQELKQFQAIEQKTRQELARRGRVAKHKFSDIQSKAADMQRVIAEASNFAHYDATVLILGETGVGKEYFAHAIHNASRRKNGPFVAVNCPSIPENILESELFGYTEGAFTGAKRGGKIGLFEQAHGGTIFLDEVGELTEQCQARLLRVLQEREIFRLGDDRTIPVDIRIIAATNRNLWAMVQEKQFREDLYYRLEVLTIEVPPLRERKCDIEMFVRQFINLYNRQYRTAVTGINAEGQALLLQYDWPGNVRELQNAVGRLVALTGAGEITAEHVRRCLKHRLPAPKSAEQELRSAEMAIIQQVLAQTGGNKQQAAKLLGICRSTLWRKLKRNH